MPVAEQLSLPDHFMRTFFLASASVDSHHNAEALQHLQVCGMRAAELRAGQPGVRCPFCMVATGLLKKACIGFPHRHCHPSSRGRTPSSSLLHWHITICRHVPHMRAWQRATVHNTSAHACPALQLTGLLLSKLEVHIHVARMPAEF